MKTATTPSVIASNTPSRLARAVDAPTAATAGAAKTARTTETDRFQASAPSISTDDIARTNDAPATRAYTNGLTRPAIPHSTSMSFFIASPGLANRMHAECRQSSRRLRHVFIAESRMSWALGRRGYHALAGRGARVQRRHRGGQCDDVGKFEQRQLRAIREALGRAHAERTRAAVIQQSLDLTSETDQARARQHIRPWCSRGRRSPERGERQIHRGVRRCPPRAVRFRDTG